MTREPEELVEMRRVLGAQLAAFRRAAALTQGQLVVAAVVDRTTVAHIVSGRSRADERFWTIADRRCRADGVLLADFHAWLSDGSAGPRGAHPGSPARRGLRHSGRATSRHRPAAGF